MLSLSSDSSREWVERGKRSPTLELGDGKVSVQP